MGPKNHVTPKQEGAVVSQPTTPLKKSKKGLIVGLVAAGVVLVGCVTGLIVYATVYNSPNNVVFDAFNKMLSAKDLQMTGTMTSHSGGVEMQGTFKTASDQNSRSRADQTITMTVGGQNMTFKVHTASTKDELFVKLDDLRTMIQKLYGKGSSMNDAIEQYYGPLLDKIDSKWVRVTMNDIEELSSGAVKGSQFVCAREAIEKVRSDNSLKNELTDLYKKNSFMQISSVGSDAIGSRYSIRFDAESMKKFVSTLRETRLFKAIDTCFDGKVREALDNAKSTKDPSTDQATYAVDVWVDGWSHDLKKVAYSVQSNGSDLTYEMLPKLNTNPTIEIPKGETSVQDLKTEIEKLQTQFQQAYDTRPLSASENVY